ncbi:6708_t:CDS:2 [Scutellospora calospora]|uniref:6708_t:CDS:1 n=1 Tax=Scutellospora calospora TaxID=85575 RepID=A0ACA9KZQ0_9GLOM|nr:6708_t:CDS:2 [Scutellospora calospora]
MKQTLFRSLENILLNSYPNEDEINTYDLTVYESLPNESDTSRELEYNYENNYEDNYEDDNYEDDNYEDNNYEDDNYKDDNSENDNSVNNNSVDNSKNTNSHQSVYLPSLHSGKYILHKTVSPKKQRNKGSKRINCPFLINISKSKSPNCNMIIKLTLICLEHNYTLIPDNAIFTTRYRKLTLEIKDLIKSFTLCNLDISSQVQLLHELFSEAIIIDYDVKNYVYKVHRSYEIQGNDAAKLLQYLEKERTKDPNWYI